MAYEFGPRPFPDAAFRNVLALVLGGGSLLGLVASAWALGERTPDWLPTGLVGTLASVTSYYFASRGVEQATRVADAAREDAVAVGRSGAAVQEELSRTKEDLAQALALLASLSRDEAARRKVEEGARRVNVEENP